MLVQKRENDLRVVCNWREESKEWKLPIEVSDIPGVDDICEKFTGAKALELAEANYFLLHNDNGVTCALVSVLKSADETDEVAKNFAEEKWDCPHALYWHPIKKEWSKV